MAKFSPLVGKKKYFCEWKIYLEYFYQAFVVPTTYTPWLFNIFRFVEFDVQIKSNLKVQKKKCNAVQVKDFKKYKSWDPKDWQLFWAALWLAVELLWEPMRGQLKTITRGCFPKFANNKWPF